MEKCELYNICYSFRKAIEKISRNNGFKHENVRNDRMNAFPCGCCDDTCDLLAYHLKNVYGIDTYQRSYSKTDCEDEYGYVFNHNVLVISGENSIIDLTGDQFGGDEIYIGTVGKYPFSTDNYRDIPNFNISDVSQSSRLFEDYNFIIRKL